MKARSKITVLVLAGILLLAASMAEIALVVNVTSAQTRKSGAERLEIISGELEETISSARFSVMKYALELQPYLDDREACRVFVRGKKNSMLRKKDSTCFNVYIASDDWSYIPDFDMPDDYDVEERSWYIGAVRRQGDAYVSDPYVDAMTGDICFSVSVMLSDGKTVAAMDYTMDSIQQHIKQLFEDETYSEGQKAVIVSNEGIISGCTDESLIGKSLTQVIPEYAGVFSLVKSSEDVVSIRQEEESIFAAKSGFGWYLIFSVNSRSLFRTSYIELSVMLFITIFVFAIITMLYIFSVKEAKQSEKDLNAHKKLIDELSSAMLEPIDKISSGSSEENVRNSSDYEQEFAVIRDASKNLTDIVSKMRSYSEMVKKLSEEAAQEKLKNKSSDIALSRHFRSIIVTVLMIVTILCAYINITSSVQYGRSQMQRSAAEYEYRLSEWIYTQKSILDMFSSLVSTNSEILDDYDYAVDYLNRITKQYPEISVSYLANPALKHTVIMNNGWEPDENWHVEERDWYKDLMASENNWLISTPYYDEQTGYYCVTFAEKVYDYRTGEFLGNFGIDFYMDKLVDILGSSYTDSGYAFLADAQGEIINHPYGTFQMTENTITNVLELPYKNVETNASKVKVIKDYDGSIKAAIATKNELSGFSIYVVNSVLNIYRSVLVYGLFCVLALIACMIVVYKVTTGLIYLQDEINNKLRESAAAAIAADEAKSTFLAQMSHEIRTPINAVLGMNEMIIRQSADPITQEYARNIQSSGRTLLSLINSILDFSKIEDGKMEIIPTQYETAVMINDLVTSIYPRANEKGLELVVDADPSLPCMLRGDDVRIKQVISNLLTNAVKYTESGTVTLIIRKMGIKDKTVSIYVEVTDTGIGIRKEDIGALFESFRRLDEERNKNIEGTGLGMSIVTKLLDMMNSKLDVKSEYGKGSTFSFSIEQQVISSNEMGDYCNQTLHGDNEQTNDLYLYAPNADILIVDDNMMNLKVAKNLIRIYGISADTASSGQEAISLVKNKHYDVIFLDHMMPKMDGIETLRIMKQENIVDESTKVIALTANAIIGAANTYLSAGFDAYLTKPIESKTLENQLKLSLPEDKKQFKKPEAPKNNNQPETPDDSFSIDELMVFREKCPSLNVISGMSYCMDSKEFYIDTLRAFAEDKRLNELEKLYSDNDFNNYRIVVHSIKSTAKTIGADILSEHAKLLEFAAKDNDIGYIKKNHEIFVKEFMQVTGEIERVIDNE